VAALDPGGLMRKGRTKPPLPCWRAWTQSFLAAGGRRGGAPLPHAWATADGRLRCACCGEVLSVEQALRCRASEHRVPVCGPHHELVEAYVGEVVSTLEAS